MTEQTSQNSQLDALAMLRRPFDASQISKLPKPTTKDGAKRQCNECGNYHAFPAIHLDYVGHADLTDRLLEADPLWTWEPVAVDNAGLPLFDSNKGLWIRLTVAGMTRLGYGDAAGKTGPNAVKEAIGDALRNAAMRFGAALDLWSKSDKVLGTGEAKEEVESPPATPSVQFVDLTGLISDLTQSGRNELKEAWVYDFRATAVPKDLEVEVRSLISTYAGVK